MGIFNLFFKSSRVPAAAAEAAASLSHQIGVARHHYSSEGALTEALTSTNVLLFMHGFISYYSAKRGLDSFTHMWAVNVKALEKVFGSELGNRLILGLQDALQGIDQNPVWFDEGFGAARFADSKGLTLLASFLEGMRR